MSAAGRHPVGRPARPPARALAALAGATLAGATLALALMASSACASPLLGVYLGGKSLLSVSLGGGEAASSGTPLIGVTALSETGTGSTQLVGVSVNGTPVAEVNTPSPGASEVVTTPTVTVTTPTTTAPSTPSSGASAPAGESSREQTAAAATAASRAQAGKDPASATAGTGDGRAGHGASAKGARSGRARAGRKHGSAGSAVAASGTAALHSTRAKASGSARSRAGGHAGSGNPLSSIGRSLPLPLPVPDWSKPIILALALLALALWVRSRRALRRASGLERRQRSLLQDLETMQAALVPAVPARVAGAEVSVAYRPAEGPAAGGDFYDVFARGEDEVALILGDVAGHGHEALQQAALARYTLRAYMQATASPRDALALTGRALAAPGAERLATVAAAVYDRRRGTLTYALAGHPHPIVIGAALPESPLSCSSPPLGWDVPTGRRQRTVTLPAGARACFFSDGLIEARCEADGAQRGELFGRERLRGLLEQEQGEDGAGALLAAVRAHARATPDDMAACIVTAAAEPPGRHLDIEELEVDRRAVAGGHLQAFLLGCGLPAVTAERLVRRARVEVEAGNSALVVIDRSRGEARATVGRAGSRGAREVEGALGQAAPATALMGA